MTASSHGGKETLRIIEAELLRKSERFGPVAERLRLSKEDPHEYKTPHRAEFQRPYKECCIPVARVLPPGQSNVI